MWQQAVISFSPGYMVVIPVSCHSYSMKNPCNILITGASSGIGEALALNYGGTGASLFLCGRHEERLDAVAEACRHRGATVFSRALDVTDLRACEEWITETDHEHSLDLVIANAGVSAGTGGKGENAEQVRYIFAVNVEGVINTVSPVLHLMRARHRGQIAIVSSITSFRGIPGAPAYSASKAAIRVWGEALRGHLFPDGMEVSVICPGFVRSKMTMDNPYPMPFLMDSTKAAQIIRKGLERNKPRIIFPRPMAIAVWMATILPFSLTDILMRRLPKKPNFCL